MLNRLKLISLASATFFLFCLSVWSAKASASTDINFVHIGSEQGLSQSTVFCIGQDLKGNMWFATYDGLNRYDGYTFTVYRHDYQDSLSIASDIVRTVHVDAKGRIWAGTYAGLSLYEPDFDHFHNFQIPVGDFRGDDGIGSGDGVTGTGSDVGIGTGGGAEVLKIAELDGDVLLLNTSDGLRVFDIATGRISMTGLESVLGEDSVTALYRFENQIFIGTHLGRLFTVPATAGATASDGSPAALRLTPVLAPALSGNPIQTMFMYGFPQFYVGTEGGGLFRINLETNELFQYTRASGDLSSDYVRSIGTDVSGNLWVGTYTALNVRDMKTGKVTVYDADPVREGSLSHGSVRSLFRDAQGGMWIGTWFGGLNYWHPLLRRFSSIRNIPYRNSLNDNVVSCISEDAYGRLWIGTNSGGVNKYDPQTGRFEFFTTADGLGANDIKALYIDGDRVLVGSHMGGLGIIDMKSGHVRSRSIGSDNIYAIVPYGGRSVLLGMLEGDVWSYDLDTGLSVKVLGGDAMASGQLLSMFTDSKGRIWIGTENGAQVYTGGSEGLVPSGVLPQNTDLSRTFINCITETSDGRFWFGTRLGLFCFDEGDGSLAHYTVRDGLSNNVVCGILEDADGNLWLSTDHGLSRFRRSDRTFRNYTSFDGLQGDQFSLYSYCRTASGRMYFGGLNGITGFNPASLPDNPFIPAAGITELVVSNVKIRPNDGSGILERNIADTDEIHLNQSNSSFSLTFAVADFISWKQNEFSYKLEGYDEGWTFVKDPNRTVSYSNLPPGRYVFKVLVSNKDGNWNNKPTELKIVIHPYWYNTFWARLIFIIVLAGAVAVVLRFVWVRKKMKMQIEFEKVDKERVREVNEMKLRFFINISHELRTPLTMIVAPLQDLLSGVKEAWALKKLRYIGKSTDRLLYLVNQLMDYRRAELGVFHLKVRRAAIQPVLEEIFAFYVQLAASEKIDYSLESSLAGREVCFDRKYVEIILNNLLSNAFKYTPAGHQIVLSASLEGEMLLLQVRDTGKGIAPEKQGRIFERFYQVDESHVGSGIGLGLVKNLAQMHHGRVGLESAPGVGSTFSVWLPAGIEAYSASEISSEDGPQEVYSANPAALHVLNAEGFVAASDDVETSVSGSAAASDAVASDDGRSVALVVEDNKEIREYIADGLSAKYRVMTAGDGQEALSLIASTQPDIILTDVMMPVMDGIKFCKTIKQNIATSHIPVIMLSAKADVKWQLSGLNVGADDYIPKPFTMSVVEAKVGNILRTTRSTIEHFSKAEHVEPDQLALNKLDEAFLKKAVAAVEAHLDDSDFSVDQFADLMNMSRSNLHLKMKALTGASATEFIRKIRFSKACDLLREGGYSIADISAMVGFGSPAYFATSFKKHFGCLPSEYGK